MSATFLFGLSLTVMAALMLAIIIKNFKNVRALLLLIPIALFLGASTAFTIQAIMSRPTARQPADFVFLEYATDGKKIFIWLAEKGKDYPITVEMPYTQKLHEQLEQAREGKRKGKLMLGKRLGSTAPDSPGGDQAPGEFMFYEFNPVTGSRLKDEGRE